MKLLFELGDRIYKKDYDENTFLEMQSLATKFCTENGFSLGENSDDNGEFLEIYSADGPESYRNLELAQINKVNSLKYCKEEIEFSFVNYLGFRFSVSELDLLRLQALILSLDVKDSIDYFDADGFKHNGFKVTDLKAIVKLYSDRLLKLDDVFLDLKNKVMSAASIDEVKEISNDDFFLI